jgi:putative heme-binding domain-containing protein
VGNPYAGKKQFDATCAKCHTLFDRGGRIGPDLTPYQRHDTALMLQHIVNPSSDIREGFEFVTASTDDFRVVSGFMADQDDTLVVIRGLDGQNVTLQRDQIESIKGMGRSLMPDGLLDSMNEQQVRDLFAYLRQAQPVTRD